MNEMKKVSGAISNDVVFVHIGGTFDKQFWQSFSPDLMENLVHDSVVSLIYRCMYPVSIMQKRSVLRTPTE